MPSRPKLAKPELLAHLSGDAADTEPAQDLPLLAALAEFDALIDRLCDLSRYPADVREEMRQARQHMAPCNVPAELDAVRDLVKRAESGERCGFGRVAALAALSTACICLLMGIGVASSEQWNGLGVLLGVSVAQVILTLHADQELTRCIR